jgi:putative component of membrane protein insertase Oxa1/YidC/SpoIIIJ protein YidD
VSLKKFGLSKGSYIGIKRILSCHPIKLLGGGSSFDFVPNKNTLKKKI